MRFILDGQPIPFQEGESILVAMLRAGEQPANGGCLCLEGDCPNCLATIDGVSYVRTCQTKAKPGMLVQRQALNELPPLPDDDRLRVSFPARQEHCDIMVIGQGSAGIAAAETIASQLKLPRSQISHAAIGSVITPELTIIRSSVE